MKPAASCGVAKILWRRFRQTRHWDCLGRTSRKPPRLNKASMVAPWCQPWATPKTRPLILEGLGECKDFVQKGIKRFSVRHQQLTPNWQELPASTHQLQRLVTRAKLATNHLQRHMPSLLRRLRTCRITSGRVGCFHGINF